MDTKLFARNQPGGLFSIINRAEFPCGNVWWVGSTVTGASDTAGFGLNPDAPFATLAYALTKVAADDTVYVMPGHTEALIAATTLDMSTAGVRVIGLGQGRRKPQFSITTAATATWNVTAANCSIENIDIISNFLNIAAAMTVGTAADGLELRKIRFYDTSVVLGALIGISIADAVADVVIEDVDYYGIVLTAKATNAILAAGTMHRLKINRCFFTGEFSNAVISVVGASTDVVLTNILEINMSETGKGILLNATTTGIADNVQAYLEDETGNEKAIAGATFAMTDRVRQTNVVTASTYLCLAADS